MGNTNDELILLNIYEDIGRKYFCLISYKEFNRNYSFYTIRDLELILRKNEGDSANF